MRRERRVKDRAEGDGLSLSLTGELPCFGHYRGIAVVLLSHVDYRALTAPAQLRGKLAPLIVTQFDRDPELSAFIVERIGTFSQREIQREAAERFGADRAPSSSALSRFISRWRRNRSAAPHP